MYPCHTALENTNIKKKKFFFQLSFATNEQRFRSSRLCNSFLIKVQV